jgi:hypothetical protein
MGFEGEFASYEPLRRLIDSEKVKRLQERIRVRKPEDKKQDFSQYFVKKSDLEECKFQPDLVLSIDGSFLPVKAENGFPGAEYGYVTVASVLIDLEKVDKLGNEEFIDPKEFRETEKSSSIDGVFPGCNVVINSEKDAKTSFRRSLFEELKSDTMFTGEETLLETYEYLFKIKQTHYSDERLPRSPIERVNAEMTYGYGEYICPHSGEALFSTDALRLHELMNTSGSCGEMYGQVMSTLEKLCLINILRVFEHKNWLGTFRRVAFIMDGPLAMFSTESWLTKPIIYELNRINELQKKINGQDLLLIGIEKSGTFFNHFMDMDTDKDGVTDYFPRQSAFLLDDKYIKENIIFSESTKPYGEDTYFGRKLFYKAASGQKIVPVTACYTDEQRNLSTANKEQFPRLADIMSLLDKLVSSRYPNSVSPLISAHSEAAIPLNLGKKIFDEIAKEIREKSNI